MHRKNSNTMQHFPNFSNTSNNNSNSHSNNQAMFYHHSNMNNNNYNKSSSYPNFANTSNTGGVLTNNVLNNALNFTSTPPPLLPPNTNKSQELQARDIQAVVNAFHETYRHSLSNLISMQQPLIMQQAIQAVAEAASQHDPTQTNENLVSSSNVAAASNNQTSSGVGGGQAPSHDKNTSSIGDINSRLEFLCLQMTEQAIN